MKYSELIDELLNELSYRVGVPDLKNKNHQSIISEILSEWGEWEVKEKIFEFLTEEERKFTNPILNKKITYVGKDGKENEGTVGNLLTSPKDSPSRIEAEKLLPKDGTPERDEINKEVGSQGGGGPQDGQQGGDQSTDDEIEQNKKNFASDPQVQKQVKKENETREKLENEGKSYESDLANSIEESSIKLKNILLSIKD